MDATRHVKNWVEPKVRIAARGDDDGDDDGDDETVMRYSDEGARMAAMVARMAAMVARMAAMTVTMAMVAMRMAMNGDADHGDGGR